MPNFNGDEHESKNLLRESGRIAILDKVASILAEGGSHMSMSELAESTGVGRATLYRYFPTRQALLESIRDRALIKLEDVLSAESDRVDSREGLAQISRSILMQSAITLLLMRENVTFDGNVLEKKLFEPIDNIIQKAINEKRLSADIDVRTITTYFLGLLRTSSVLIIEKKRTPEEATSLVLRILFQGFAAIVH